MSGTNLGNNSLPDGSQELSRLSFKIQKVSLYFVSFHVRALNYVLRHPPPPTRLIPLSTCVSLEPEYNRRCVYKDGDAEDLRLVDLMKLHKLDPRINPRIGNAKITTKSTINRANSEGLFDSDSSDATSDNGPSRRIGGKKNHDSVEGRAKDVLAFNLESDPEFDDDDAADDDNSSNDEADGDDDDDNSDDEVDPASGNIDIPDKRDDDVALTMDDKKFAKAVRKHLSGIADKNKKRVAKLVLMEIKKYGGRLLQAHRSGTGRSPIVGYIPLNDADAQGSEFVCH